MTQFSCHLAASTSTHVAFVLYVQTVVRWYDMSPRTRRQPRLRIPAPEVNGTFQTHSDNLKSGCTFVCGADENTSFVYFRLESNIYAQICPDYKPLWITALRCKHFTTEVQLCCNTTADNVLSLWTIYLEKSDSARCLQREASVAFTRSVTTPVMSARRRTCFDANHVLCDICL